MTEVTRGLKWKIMDPSEIPDPTYGPPCGALLDHEWTLEVDEGRVVLYSDCEECNDYVMSPVGGEDVGMGPIKGKLLSHLEKSGYYTIEYDHWWEFVPEGRQ